MNETAPFRHRLYNRKRKFSLADSNSYTSIGRSCHVRGQGVCQNNSHRNIFQSRNLTWDVCIVCWTQEFDGTFSLWYKRLCQLNSYHTWMPLCSLLITHSPNMFGWVFFLCVCASGITYFWEKSLIGILVLKTQQATQPVLQSVNVWITWTRSTPGGFFSAHSLAGLKTFNQTGCLLAADAFLALHKKEGQTVKKWKQEIKKWLLKLPY